jgi:uncharacterized protein
MTQRAGERYVTVSLRDGRSVLLRPLTVDDGDALIDAVHHADVFDLRRRFMGSPPPAHVLARLLARADGVHDTALGAFEVDGRLVGVAQFDRRDDSPTAEFALEVATGWQRCGLGAALLRQLGVLAQARGISRFTAVYLADNTPIIRLMRSTGCTRWLGTESGASWAELDVELMLAGTGAVPTSGRSPLGRGPATTDHGTVTGDPAELTVLPRIESLALLGSVAIGRIVFTDRAMPAITPVNFAVLPNGDIVIRSGPGSKLSAATRGAVVAFEADEISDSRHDGWSVVVTGHARHVVSADELAEIDGSLPAPWVAGERHDVIRISADIVEGRRSDASDGAAADVTDVPA